VTRRLWLLRAASMIACSAKADTHDNPYDGILRSEFKRGNLAGLQACVIEDGKPAWFNAYGLADVQRRVSMTPDTVINIASVSKTVTACAVMQLWEKRKLALDETIDRYLPFPVRNPIHATTAITARHLLAHTSSIADGPAYAPSYSCGTSTPALRDWLSEYVRPRGRYYSQENFNTWPPGQRFQYSNVGFGLLGCAVEAVSGQPFSAYCHREIFQPLGMQSTSFGASNVSSAQQAIPYTIAEEGRPRERVVREGGGAALEWNGTFYIPNCLYSFPTFPDGLVRTTVRDFSRFMSAVLCSGDFEGHRILRPGTPEKMFDEQFPNALRPSSWPAVQGLAWYAIRLPDSSLVWLHTGADPGVGTVAICYPPRRSAVLLFANTAPAEGLSDLAGTCLRQAARSSATR